MMPFATERSSESSAPPKKAGARWDVLLGDLSLLVSLWLARLIVRRVLRARRRERAARLRNLRVISGSTTATAKDRAPMAVCPDEGEILRGTARVSAYLKRG